jgi:hypothetical protein
MKHDVKFLIPERNLGRADIEFHVRKSGKKFGTLKVSKGSIVWVPKDNTYGYKVGWDKFDTNMQRDGKREKGRSRSQN